MKKLLLIYSLLFSCIGISQIENVEPSQNFTANVSCASAMKVCENINQTYDFEAGNNEQCDQNKLFYVFHFAGPSVGGNQINVPGSNGSYSWFGPFEDFDLNICDQVNSYSVGSIEGQINNSSFNLTNSEEGYYLLIVKPNQCSGSLTIINTGDVRYNCAKDVLCTECVTSFSPTPGKYIISAWMKEANAIKSVTSYTEGAIQLSFDGTNQTLSPMLPSGAIIDGWQRIESEFEIPIGSTGINIALIANGEDIYFDDIRFFPIDGSMMSYVYDPISLRLMAELDERNYATLYEYDEEGKLIRVKKETERGIMTIQENRDNIKKQ
ncbi:MAG: hypothetical protein EP305_04495 [Bacteroidetes bacterium]|nr:MAG: hypothetical protein EP305_04495 [Bacteroidota bacterium]